MSKTQLKMVPNEILARSVTHEDDKCVEIYVKQFIGYGWSYRWYIQCTKFCAGDNRYSEFKNDQRYYATRYEAQKAAEDEAYEFMYTYWLSEADTMLMRKIREKGIDLTLLMLLL